MMHPQTQQNATAIATLIVWSGILQVGHLQLKISRTSNVNGGGCMFAKAGQTLWKLLPKHIRDPQLSFDYFKTHHLYCQTYHGT